MDDFRPFVIMSRYYQYCTNNNNTSTPSSSLSAGAVAYPWIRPNRVQHDNTQYTLNLPLLVLCVFLY